MIVAVAPNVIVTSVWVAGEDILEDMLEWLRSDSEFNGGCAGIGVRFLMKAAMRRSSKVRQLIGAIVKCHAMLNSKGATCLHNLSMLVQKVSYTDATSAAICKERTLCEGIAR